MLECGWEARIQRAAVGGSWDDEVRAHIGQCSVCAEIALVAGAMRAESIAGRAEAGLPEPGRVWWRARLLAKREAIARATRPIAIWERFASVAGLAVGTVVAWWFWPALTSSALDARHAWVLIESTSLGMVVNYVALGAVTFLVFLIWFGLFFIRTEA